MDGRPTLTHCPYCSLQCGITLRVAPDRVDLASQEDFPINRVGLGSKGWNAAEFLDHPDRLIEPLVRGWREATLQPTTWDDVLDWIAQVSSGSQQNYGPDSVGCFGGGGLTNEKAYQLGKFARVALGTSPIDYNGRFCMSSAAAAATRAFGIDRDVPFPLADIAAANVVLLAGANPADTMPPGPGTDLALANGLLHLAIRLGLIDTAYIADRTCGVEQARRVVRSCWPPGARPGHRRARGIRRAGGIRRAVPGGGPAGGSSAPTRSSCLFTGMGCRQPTC